MMEHITFPENKIPEVIRVIRLGLIWCEAQKRNSKPEEVIISDETKKQLIKQCDHLEQYWKNQITDD